MWNIIKDILVYRLRMMVCFQNLNIEIMQVKKHVKNIKNFYMVILKQEK